MGSEGMKYDQGKTMWNLLPLSVLSGVAQVLTFGASKYKARSWQGVEPERYYAAMMRHLEAIAKGEDKDNESGLHHAHHFCCNAIFMAWALARGNTQWLKEIFDGD